MQIPRLQPASKGVGFLNRLLRKPDKNISNRIGDSGPGVIGHCSSAASFCIENSLDAVEVLDCVQQRVKQDDYESTLTDIAAYAALKSGRQDVILALYRLGNDFAWDYNPESFEAQEALEQIRLDQAGALAVPTLFELLDRANPNIRECGCDTV